MTPLCLYCDKKDSCCQCKKNIDVIWGEITGDLQDQTDLANMLFSKSHFIPADLKIIDRNLYIVAPIGLINESIDEPIFGRNVRSSIRIQNEEGYLVGHHKRSGWIIPTHNTIGEKKVYVLLKMEKVKRYDSNVFDYFRLSSAASTYNMPLEERNYTTDIGADFYYAEEMYKDKGTIPPLKLHTKKLGVCVRRYGKQITQWLPFTTRADAANQQFVLSRMINGFQK